MTFSGAVLVGNSNVGKTTLFNTLTGGDEHTGNWAGVTVRAKSGDGGGFTVTDLPGIYSLGCFSMEERAARDYLSCHNDRIFNVVECRHLAVNLYLTLQLVEAGYSPVVLVNMLGELEKRGGRFDPGALASALRLDVEVADARDRSVKDRVKKYLGNPTPPPTYPYIKKLPLEKMGEICGVKDRGRLIRIFEGEYDGVDPRTAKRLDALLAEYGDRKGYMARLRYEFIDRITAACLTLPKERKRHAFTGNRYFILAVCAAVMGLVFWLTFAPDGVGGLCVSLIDSALTSLKGKATVFLADVPPWLSSFVTDALIEGVGVVAKFLPQVTLLFFFLNMLEDTGYIARAAFMLDGVLAKIGLSGKSVFTLLLCFGCNTTAAATSGNLGDKETQRRTLLMAPFFPCGAKLPVYLTVMSLTAPLFSGAEIYVVAAMYAVCVASAFALAAALRLFGEKRPAADFVMELPPLRVPSVKRVASSVAKNAVSFMSRLAGALLLCVAFAWLLRSFDFGFNYLTADMAERSVLAWIGKNTAFLFRPIGIDDWRICVALILGVTAKEVVAGTLLLLFGSSPLVLSWQAAVSVMLFTALYVPCAATVAVIKKECGGKTAALSVLLNTGTAYGVCFVFYNFAAAFEKSAALGVSACIVVAVLAMAVYLVLKYKNKCENCGRCRVDKPDLRRTDDAGRVFGGAHPSGTLQNKKDDCGRRSQS